MNPAKPNNLIEKLTTNIPGFDLVAYGGVPRGRTTLVAGTSGSAKTVFAAQFLAEGVVAGEPGVFVTFEEHPSDIQPGHYRVLKGAPLVRLSLSPGSPNFSLGKASSTNAHRENTRFNRDVTFLREKSPFILTLQFPHRCWICRMLPSSSY